MSNEQEKIDMNDLLVHFVNGTVLRLEAATLPAGAEEHYAQIPGVAFVTRAGGGENG